MNQRPIITLTTDFGVADGYVGTMKGVMLGIAPHARLVDLTHRIAPQGVRQAAYVLYTAYRFFPAHAVHLVVVDPGVGSSRRAIALRTGQGLFVGPDNGVFGYVMAEEAVEAVVELVDPRYRLARVSHTFHGRDIFAPAAAHLAAGVPLEALGPPVLDPVRLPLPRLEVTSEGVAGEVLHADHFGNLITSIGRLWWSGEALSLEPAFRGAGRRQGAGGKRQEAGAGEPVRFRADAATVRARGRELQGVHRTYAEVERGEVLALVGSEGHLELAVREGSGADRLGLRPGDGVTLRWRSMSLSQGILPSP